MWLPVRLLRGRVAEDAVLAKLAVADPDPSIRLAAVRRLKDQTVLASIAKIPRRRVTSSFSGNSLAT